MKEPLEKAERRFVGVSLAVIALFLGGSLWWGKLNEVPELAIPTPPMPEKNAFTLWQDAMFYTVRAPAKPPVDAIVDGQGVDGTGKEVPRSQWAKVYPLARKEAWLAQNAKARQLFRQGLKLPYREPAARSFYKLFPHYAKYRAFARMLVVESRARAERGDIKGATDSALDIVAFGNAVPRGGPLIGSLVGYAMQSIGRKQMQELLPQTDAATAKAAVRRLEKLRGEAVPFAETMQEEKWCMQASVLEAMRKRDWMPSLTGLAASGGGPANSWQWYFVPKRTVVENLTRFMDKSIAEARKPYLQQKLPTETGDPISQMICGVYSRAYWNAARTQTGNDLLTIALALRAYRLEKGAYPAKLADLVPGYLQSVPIDGFDGANPLFYRRNGADFLLWSIGPDGKNNNATPIKSSTPTNRYLDGLVPIDIGGHGDWVWGKNR